MLHKRLMPAAVLACSIATSLAPVSAQDAQTPGQAQPSQNTAPAASPPPGQSAAPAPTQTNLPPITVTAPQEAKPNRAQPKTAAAAPRASSPPTTTTEQTITPAPDGQQVITPGLSFDKAQANILPKIGTDATTIGRTDIESMPQGANAPLEKILLQAPGVTQDSAASGDLHVRNEHANIGYRINGILLPDGVSGFGQFIESGFVDRLTLLTGALPAQYGLRTAGVIDIETRKGGEPGGNIGVYGGSHGTLEPTFDYGGVAGRTEYFFSSRGNWNSLGLENPTPAYNAIHDRTEQGSAFGYTSTLLDPQTRITTMAGLSVQHYQIPNNPGQTPVDGFNSVFGVSNFDSANLNERQLERSFYGVAAWQKKLDGADLQLAYFTRFSTLHFSPDTIGDFVFNGVASDVYRSSFLNGLQGDGAFRLNSAHTLRAGFTVSGERAQVTNISTVEPADFSDNPFNVTDANSKFGWLIGLYVQDEWKITPQLTLNTGLRFDQMFQYVDANQFSPRVGLEYRPVDGTMIHAGYARYFTPPSLVLAAPTNLALFTNTTAQPEVGLSSPVKPERSHVFDVGVDQKVAPGLTVGLDGYYKIAKDLIDDGQFGNAYVLQAFNYDRGTNYGIELKTKYQQGGWLAYGNLAWATQRGQEIVSNQFLFGQDELDYIAQHSIYTDHAQYWTGSAGISYKWDQTKLSADLIYGSGLRTGDFNSSHVPNYTQVNVGLAQDLSLFRSNATKPTTIRFDVINVFDEVYEIRDGSGIGVFAPQYGPRRTFFVGVNQKF